MMLERNESCLVVIDVQQRLLPGVIQSRQLVERCDALVELAQTLDIPVFATEQYPQGIGPSDEALRQRLGEQGFVGKTFFSCVDAPEFAPSLQQMTQPQVVICGMEAHACVLQSALGFLALGKQVFVVADAISARHPQDLELAIERMRAAGITLISAEMAGFEWLRRSDVAAFKHFSERFLR